VLPTSENPQGYSWLAGASGNQGKGSSSSTEPAPPGPVGEVTALDSGEGVVRVSTSTGEFTRSRRELFSGFEGLEVASRRVDESGRPSSEQIGSGGTGSGSTCSGP
jgi:hypothetical protein